MTTTRRRLPAVLAVLGLLSMLLAVLPATAASAQQGPVPEVPDVGGPEGDAPPCLTTADGTLKEATELSNGVAIVDTSKLVRCYSVVLSSYEIPGTDFRDWSEQRLFDSTEPVVVGPGDGVETFRVATPPCNHQTDFYVSDEVLGDDEQGAPHHDAGGVTGRSGILVAYEVFDGDDEPCGPPPVDARAACEPDGVRVVVERYTLDEAVTFDVRDGSDQSILGNQDVFETTPPPRAPLDIDVTYAVDPADGPFVVTATLVGADTPFFTSEPIDVRGDCAPPPSSPPPPPAPTGASADSSAVCSEDGSAVVRYRIVLEDASTVGVVVTDASGAEVFTDTVTTSGLFNADLPDALLGETVTVTLTPDVGDVVVRDVLVDDTACVEDVTEVLDEELEQDEPEVDEPEVVEPEDGTEVLQEQVDEPAALPDTGAGVAQLLALGLGTALAGGGLLTARRRD